MKESLIAILFCLTHYLSYGQTGLSKVPHLIDLTKENFTETIVSIAVEDSTKNPTKNSAINSLVNDSLAHAQSRMDSLQKEFQSGVDSLAALYAKSVTGIQSSIQHFRAKIDSLQSLKLPTQKYSSKLDGLSRRLALIQNEWVAKIEDLKKRALKKIEEMKLPRELNQKVSTFTSTINDLALPAVDGLLPQHLGSEQFNIHLDNGDIPNVQLPAANNVLTDLTDLKEINHIGEIPSLGHDVKGIQSAIDNVDDLKPESIDRLAEASVVRIKEVEGIKQQTANLPPLTMKSEEEMKAELKAKVREIAVDHFADNQEQLKEAMTKISRYKATYSNVNSVADISMRPPNPMKDKPLIERIIPGLALQVQKKGDLLLVDFNPYAGYRFTGRITAGSGWNQRIPYNMDNKRFSSIARVYGPRVFGEFKLSRGFAPRAEIEVMRTLVPPLTQSPTIDPGKRKWVWGLFVGMKKEYRLFSSVKGTASVMLRVFDPNHKSPYADVINARIGFEFPMKKKTKQQTSKN